MEQKNDILSLKWSPTFSITSEVYLLSDLPDELLVCILSVLPTKNAIQTSILSRWWTNLWKYTHNVSINYNEHFEFHSKKKIFYVNKIAQVLLYHPIDIDKLLSSFNSPKLCKVHLILPPIRSESIKISFDSCVDFAFERHVEDLALVYAGSFTEGCIFYAYLHLPSKIFEISSLVNLKLVNLEFHLPLCVRLPFLRTLELINTSMTAQQVQNLVENCPSLKTLLVKIPPCTCMNSTLSINHVNLKSLFLDVQCPFRLNTPSLDYLKIRQHCNDYAKGDYLLEDVSPFLKCLIILEYSPNYCTTHLKALAALHLVKAIHFQVLKYYNPKLCWPATIERTCRIIEVTLTVYSNLEVIAHMLVISPQTQKIVFIIKELELGPYFKKKFLRNEWKHFTRMFPNCLQLEEVEIHGFSKSESRSLLNLYINCQRKVNLVKFLIKKSKVLKTITVYVDKYAKSAPILVRLEFSKCLWEIQLCGQAPSGPTINIIYL